MQRVSPRASLIGLALAGGLIAAMLIVFMLTIGSQGTPKAQAVVSTDTPTATAKPTPLPSPYPSGNTSGVYDLWIYNAAAGKASSLYDCIIRIEQDNADNVKSAAQCYTELNTGDSNGEPPPGSLDVGPIKTVKGTPVIPIDAGPDGLAGPPPPPPYLTLPVSKGFGSVVAGVSTTYTCFANVGGTASPLSLGPNVIAKLVVTNFAGQMAGTDGAPVNHKVDTGTHHPGDGVYLYTKQSAATCANPTTVTGTPLPLLNVNITNANAADPRCVAACDLAPWRNNTSGLHGYPDWDQDGCTDANELWVGKAGTTSPKGCGDDPWNPNDPSIATGAGVAGVWDLAVQVARQDICISGQSVQGPCTGADGTLVPGYYFTCNSHIIPNPDLVATHVKAKVLCYTDSKTFTVNPDNIPGADGGPGALTCVADGAPFTSVVAAIGPAAREYCGDGSPGAYPPGCTDNVTMGQAAPAGYVAGTAWAYGEGPPWVMPCAKTLPQKGTVAADAAKHCPAANVAGTIKIYCQPQRWLFAGLATLAKGQTNLIGTIDQNTNTITLQGCFNPNNPNPPFAVPAYAKAVFNLNTGHGTTSVWVGRLTGMTDTQCKSGVQPGGAATFTDLPTDLVRQACDLPDPAGKCDTVNNSATWDTDGDGCIDVQELSDTVVSPVVGTDGGGMRDPNNRWDFFDPAKSTGANAHKHNSSDITAVVAKFAKNEWKTDSTVHVINNLSQDNAGVATVISPSHGLTTGATVIISNAAPSKYNGTYVITVVDANTFTYPLLPAKAADTATSFGTFTLLSPIINPLYDSNMDRTGVQGSNNWNLGPPNGFITSADILAAVKSYNQNCKQALPVNK